MDNFNEALETIVVVGGAFATILLMRWLTYRTFDSRARIQADLYKQLLDKFGSGRELAEFLATERGKNFLQNLASEGTTPQGKILASLNKGVMMTFMGLAVIILNVWISDGSAPWERGLLVGGIFLFAAGVGYVIAAGISYRLSKKWGLIKEERPNIANETRG